MAHQPEQKTNSILVNSIQHIWSADMRSLLGRGSLATHQLGVLSGTDWVQSPSLGTRIAASLRFAGGPPPPQGWERNAKALAPLVEPPMAPGDMQSLDTWLRKKLSECVDYLKERIGRGKNPTPDQQEARSKINDATSARQDPFRVRERMIDNFTRALFGAARRGQGVGVGNHIMGWLREWRDCRISFEELCGFAEIYASLHGT